MTQKKSGLGRGLSALIPDRPKPAAPLPPPPAEVREGARRISVAAIEPNPFQPRQHFQPEALAELVASVKEKGVLQPLLVRPHGNGFQLIAGERRFRAAMEAGLRDVPVVVLELTDQESLELAMIENLQRQDLNPMEEAEGYKHLMDRFHLTQEAVAQKVGKARASVANALRLVNLAPEARRLLREGAIQAGHAKALLSLEVPAEQDLIAGRIAKEGLSVREVERLMAQTRNAPKKPRAERGDIPASHLRHLSDILQQRLGTSVRVTSTRLLANGKRLPGKLEVDFFSPDDLDRLLELLGVKDAI
jgi:ParB family transcriptional regulator, chromosome partitioning protein